jgi:putative membrane protein
LPDILPYCGRAPAPEELLERWNLDPALVAALVLVAAL